MGILKGLFRTRDAPTNRTIGSAYSFFMGNSTSGKRVNERSAMQMTAVCDPWHGHIQSWCGDAGIQQAWSEGHKSR